MLPRGVSFQGRGNGEILLSGEGKPKGFPFIARGGGGLSERGVSFQSDRTRPNPPTDPGGVGGFGIVRDAEAIGEVLTRIGMDSVFFEERGIQQEG